jgi:hypothetical protein
MRDEHKADPKLQKWAKKQLNDNPNLNYPKKYTPNPFEGQERPEDDFDRLARDKGRTREDIIESGWDELAAEMEWQRQRDRDWRDYDPRAFD